MATVAILCLLLLERFLASDMDVFTEPVLVGLRALEKTTLGITNQIIPSDLLTRHKRLSKFYLYTPEMASEGVRLNYGDKSGFMHFHPNRETKMIIHGFMDKVKIAQWMHHMKDEFLLLDEFNVIIVDWSVGNTIPYRQAAANTEKAGGEIAELIQWMIENFGAQPRKFHLLGHSLGSHVAGFVGEKIRGLKRITGLDPATHTFSSRSARSKLDRTDAEFVDIIHTDAGGIGIDETEGDIDFYPNGGEVQPGCTASNSLRALIEKGVVEGVRNIICSHMRAPMLFADTINSRSCQLVGHKCPSYALYKAGECDSCGENGADCAIMGYHVDPRRKYANGTKFYLLTGKEPPFCGFEYKISFERVKEEDKTWRNILPNVFRRRSTRREWTPSDILHVALYGSSGSVEFELEGKEKQPFQSVHVIFSPIDLGLVHGAIVHWTKKPVSRTLGVTLSSAMGRESNNPLINRIEIKSFKSVSLYRGRSSPLIFQLCMNPKLSVEEIQKGATYRHEYC